MKWRNIDLAALIVAIVWVVFSDDAGADESAKDLERQQFYCKFTDGLWTVVNGVNYCAAPEGIKGPGGQIFSEGEHLIGFVDINESDFENCFASMDEAITTAKAAGLDLKPVCLSIIHNAMEFNHIKLLVQVYWQARGLRVLGLPSVAIDALKAQTPAACYDCLPV